MKVCANVKIRVSEKDASRLFSTFSAYHYAWQTVSDWAFENGSVSQMEAQKATYYKVREAFPELPANLVQAARTDALAKLKAAKSNRHKISNPPKLKKVTLRYDTRTSKIAGNTISLSACGGSRIRVTFENYPRLEEFRAKYKMLSPGIFYRDGQFWAALIFEVPETFSGNSSVVGIDMGQRNFVATSEGKIYKCRKLNRLRRKTKFLKRKLQSKGTKSARAKNRSLSRKERRQSLDEVYCLAKKVIKDTEAGVFVVEKLKTKPRKGFGKKAKNRRKYAVPVGKFLEVLKYKTSFCGKKTVEVSPYMTSQDDSRGLPRGIRKNGLYIGVDGKHLNADINAAINIARKFETNPFVPKGYEWQAEVTQPIVCQPRPGESYNS